MPITLILFGAYLLTTVGIGLWAARRAEGTQEDYFLAGRKLSAVSMALSAVSSGRSAWLVVGASAAAWSTGLSALWLFPGYIAAEALMFVTLGPRLRKRSSEAGAITIPEALERIGRGDERSRLPVRALAGLIICVFLLTYVSAQLGAGAKTLGRIFEIEGGTWGLLITAGIVLVYTLLGGYRAVVVTDVIQAVLMLFGMVVLPLLGLAALGGFDGLVASLEQIDPQLLAWNRGWLALIGGVSIGFGSFGNPHILVRHMSLRDPREARAAMLTGTLWNLIMAAGSLLMGLVGRALYSSVDALGGKREYLYAHLSQEMAGQYLFAGFVGVLLATLFAAIMSTCDSQLLVIASSFVRDFRGKRAPRGEEAGGLAKSRLAVLVTLLGAVAISYGELPIVNNLVLLSWGALGAAIGPPLILLLYDPRTSRRGLFFGMLSGALSLAGAWWFWARPQGKHIGYELCFAFVFAMLVTFLLRHPRAEADR
jgi:SSS family solute:Na+ symporter/sodium/proline symporter